MWLIVTYLETHSVSFHCSLFTAISNKMPKNKSLKENERTQSKDPCLNMNKSFLNDCNSCFKVLRTGKGSVVRQRAGTNVPKSGM